MKKLIQSKTIVGALTAVSFSLISAWGIATAHDTHHGFYKDIAGIANLSVFPFRFLLGSRWLHHYGY